MSLWLDIKGAILADTAYKNGKLVGKDVTISLPAVNFKTADFKAMGDMSVPLPLIEAMEAAITKIGTDLGLRELVKLESQTLEFRWVQDVKKNDGTTEQEGCKAFIRCTPKTIPGLTVDPGNVSESELAFSVTRYQLFVGGKEYWLIDQLNQILRVDGVDYYKKIRSLL